MTRFLQCLVYISLIWPLSHTEAFPRSSHDKGDSRKRRDVSCRENLEYSNGNICCLNCPAGTHMTSPCPGEGQKGTCEECDFGTYMEHSNGLKQCFKCTQCRSDQEVVRPCTHTQDAECQCKVGKFCVHDDPCEVCKKCSRCEQDEEVVRNCTATTNTQCKKKQPDSVSGSAGASVIVSIGLAAFLVVGILIAVCVWRRRRTTDSQRYPEGLKAGQRYSDNCPTERSGETRRQSSSHPILSRPLVRTKSSAGMEEERKVLCESLSSSASNSQHSLTALPCSAYPAPPPSPVVLRQPTRREEEKFHKLVPMHGEESLRSCFHYFEEIDFNLHKKFFRHLGINDNKIKSKDNLPYDDKIHELLNIWMEKEGRGADLNDLLKALLDLNQRRTAEDIKEKAVQDRHYCISEC
ncbi:hematopoietic death receptor [Plectropomus leopardus]|uniref:hematopoietic death receptor n=1 Tax=Plectropomus leopardus TaxID=160734 RepID=UPI001C4D8B12|nr:hematopoietic death receptor [Plectropomus leopardus]